MPLYEFYCHACHRIYTFRSMKVRSGDAPCCPRCNGEMKREVSPFSHSMRGERDVAMNGDADACDRMDRVIAEMGERMQALEDDSGDPREAVSILRKMAEAGGVRFKPEIMEAMARIDAGEDPDRVDEMFSDVFETDNPFEETDSDEESGNSGWWKRLHEAGRDPEWYDWPAE